MDGGSIQRMADGFHPPLEEYLEAIHELEEEGTQVIQARVAERLSHSAPAVSEMMRRLKAEGYLTIEGRSVVLTVQGRNLAESVVRKHRLAERLLTDIIGLPWHKAHLEACRWEHVISDEVEARLIEVLGNPSTCPHGNPIPGSAAVDDSGQVALADVQAGERILLRRVTEQVELNFEALSYLSDNGFFPGIIAQVVSRAPDGTLTLDIGERSFALGPALTQQLFVVAA
jgi:DtxR family Mn-dependent transcriptional regulator